MIVWGHDGKIEKHARWEEACPSCGRPTPWEHATVYRRFKLYWIPVAKYGKKHLIYCSICTTGLELTEEAHVELLQKEAAIRAADRTELPARPDQLNP